MASITSSGEILPCNQMSGFFLKNAMSLGNEHRTPLRELLGGGDYVKYADMTVGELRAGSGKCAKCPHFDVCGGGCRALGLLYSGCRGLTGLECEDVTKCYFFENGWYQKVTHGLSEWTNHSDIAPRGRRVRPGAPR